MKQIAHIRFSLVAISALAAAHAVQADDLVWQDDAAARGTEESPIDIYNAAKWDPAYLPSSSHVPFFTDAGMTYVMNGCPNAAATPIGANAAINGDFTFLGDYYFAGELYAPYAKSGMLRDTLIVKKGNWSMSKLHLGPSDQPANLWFKNVSGDLTIRDSNNLSIGRYHGFSVTVEKDAGNWTMPIGFYLGRAANSSTTFYHRGGNMDVSSAGDEWFCLGEGQDSVNEFYMTGGTLTTHSWFLLGDNTSTTQGRNYFEVSNAMVTQTGLNGVFIGYKSGGHNELCVKAGGTFNAEYITIGNDEPGKGILTVDGGDVNVVGNVTIANTSAPGSVTLKGGRLTASKVLSAGKGNASLVFNGGTLRAKRTGTLIDVNDKLTVTVGANGGTIDCAGFSPTIKEDLYDASGAMGGMTFKGGGSVTLSGSIGYTGGTTIEAGTTLLVDTAAKKDAILGSGLHTLKFIPVLSGTYALVTITGEDTFTDGDELKVSVADGFVTEATFALSSDKKSLTVTVGSTLVFPGATLADLATHTLRARMGGSGFDADGVEATFFNRTEDDNGVTYQLQAIDDGSNGHQVRAVKVTFTEGTDGVYAKLADGNYTTHDSQYKFGIEPLTSNAGKEAYVPYDFRLVEPVSNSINVNINPTGRDGAENQIDTTSSVRYGAGDYAVPYSAWSNFDLPKGQESTSTTIGGVVFTVSGQRGNYYCEKASATKDVRHGYIDDSAECGSPTLTATGIPYDFYRIVVYMATDTAGNKFNYVTINGKNYTASGDALSSDSVTTIEGTSTWGKGNGGTGNYLYGLKEGLNYLVSPVLCDSTATVVGHFSSGARGNVAAIQIVEYVPPVYTATIDDGGNKTFSALDWDKTLPAALAESDEVVVNVNEDTTLTFDSALDICAIKFNVAEGKTLTLAGSNVAARSITATGLGQTVVASASQLAGTVKGDGNLVYGAAPSGVTFADSSWSGVLWLKNCAIAGPNPSTLASANSTLRLTGVTGYFNTAPSSATPQVCAGTLELVDDGATNAFVVDNGWSDNGITVFEKLKGDGTLGVSTRDIAQRYVFKDASEFTGTINLAARPLRVILGNGASLNPARGTITVVSGATATVAAGKTWTANYGGMVVDGTLMLGAGATAPSVVSGTGAVGVASGTGTLNGYGAGAALTLATMPGATLAIVDAGLTTMTVGLFNNYGTIDLTGTALTEATLSLASGVTAAATGTVLYPETFEKFVASPADQSVRSLRGFTPLTLPEGATYYVVLTETCEEFGNGSMTVTDVAEGVNVRVVRPNGTSIDMTPVDGTVTLTEAPQIYGVATVFDFTYTNTAACAYSAPGLSIGWNADVNPLTYNNYNANKTTGAYIKHHPWVNGAGNLIHDLENFTIVLVGTMSPSHNTQFFHMGTTGDGSTGLLITTTANDDEVLIAKNTGSTVDAAGGVKASVPNAATARHAYVINKKGTVFEVWVDGVKRGQFDGGEGFTLSAGGMQIGSDHGGNIKKANIYKAVPNNDSETGCVNVLRMFDYVISDAQAEAVFAEYPYVSQGGLYTRTIAADGTFSETGAWAKEGAEGAFDVPIGAMAGGVYYNPSATLTVNAAAGIEVNADVALETLTVGGTAPVTFAADGAHTLTVVGAAIINSPVTNEYGAVYLAGAPVQLGSSGSICFDCSKFDISGIFETTRYQLTGLIDRNDAKVTFIPPAGGSSATAALIYNATGSCYDFVVTPDHEAGSDIYYKSGIFEAGSTDLVVVLADGTTPTMIYPGDNVVFDDSVAGENAVVQFGETLPANVTFSFGNWTGAVVPVLPSSMYIWTGEAGDGKANTAGNWYGGLMPPVGAAVYIPSKTATIDNDIDGFAPASITFGYGPGVVAIVGNAITNMQEITNLSYSAPVVNVPVLFAEDVVLNYTGVPVDFAGGATGRTLVLNGLENGGWHLKGTLNLETWQGAYCFIDAGATVNAATASGLGDVRVEAGGRLVVGDYALDVTDPSAAVKWVLYYNKGHFIVTNALTNTSSERTSMFSSESGSSSSLIRGTNIIARLVNTPTADVEFLLGKYGDLGTGFDEWVRATYQFGTVTWGERSSPIVGWRQCSPKIYFAETSTLAAVASGQYIGCLEDEQYNACDIEGNPSDITLDCDISYVDYGGCLYGVTFGGGGKFTLAADRRIKRGDKTVTVAGGTTLALMPGSNIKASSLSVESGSSLEVAGSDRVTFDASLQLADGAGLGFNFTRVGVAPVLDLTDKTVTFPENGTVNVSVSASNGVRPAFGSNGKYVLTSGGKFTDVNVSRAAGNPDWVKGVSVENGEIVVEVSPLGMFFYLR